MREIPALLAPADVDRLRDALAGAGYTTAGIAERLGPRAAASLGRHDHRAALRATASGDPLDTLIRLYVCGRTEPARAVRAALGPLGLDAAVAAGLVEPDGDGLRAGTDLEPYGDWWVLADLDAGTRPRPLDAEHVLGVGGASSTLAGATPRRPVGTALDIGTGCGVQALHLSTHAARVTATDLSRRALAFAATTAALNGLSWELLEGDLAAPVRGRRFDLVVSNPPFVAGPPGPARYAYRDSGRAGDALCAELAAAAPGLLAEHGTVQFLANWLHVRGQAWQERVAGWFAGGGLDVWAVQREVTDPVGYVDLWLADATEQRDPDRVAAWLDWFDEQDVEAVGFGVVTARRCGRDEPVVRIEELRQALDQPLGAQVAAWFDRQDWLAGHPGGRLLEQRYRTADGLTLHQEATRGGDGWAVDRQVLELAGGLRWAEEVDPLVLALVSGCDGTVPLAEQVTLLALAHEVPPEQLADVAGPLVGHLVERGFLVPAEA